MRNCFGYMIVVWMIFSYGVWWLQSIKHEKELLRCEAKVQSTKSEIENLRLDLKDAVLEFQKEQQQRIDVSSELYEMKRGENNARVETVKEVVEKFVDRPIYKSECIDSDGLRIVNDQIRRTTPTGN